MKKLNITEGEYFKGKDLRPFNIFCRRKDNGESVLVCHMSHPTYSSQDYDKGKKEKYSNFELVFDTFNTFQKTGMLPSEIAKENQDLKEALEKLLLISTTIIETSASNSFAKAKSLAEKALSGKES